MKTERALLTILLASTVAVGMVSTALSRDYNDRVAEGYRRVPIDGPYYTFDQQLSVLRNLQQMGARESNEPRKQIQAGGCPTDSEFFGHRHEVA
jgi:hypothetical protein